jgi:hypothetical protein
MNWYHAMSRQFTAYAQAIRFMMNWYHAMSRKFTAYHAHAIRFLMGQYNA